MNLPAMHQLLFGFLATGLAAGCAAPATEASNVAMLQAQVATDAQGQAVGVVVEIGHALEGGDHTIPFEVEIPEPGRYRTSVSYTQADRPLTLWVEDYIGNPDGRSYDITGPMIGDPAMQTELVTRDGSPLNSGRHPMQLHVSSEGCEVLEVRFDLLRRHQDTPTSLTQNMEGDEWELVWADEFNGEGLPDESKWTHDLGNWGWGNREPQYYTEGRVENARQENGVLIIEARPDDRGHEWTSARLTTRGKVSFLYGRIVMRAKVPAMDGTWAAGWTLGDAYRDELSWPYCGEIDICEGVGREIDDVTGNGINHGSCHTRAYYFKQGNHISNTIEIEDMGGAFHDYVCEWDPTGVRMYVDGQHYYTYDKTANELEWPFSEPQNLILNLAMGGGMGGSIDEAAQAQRFEIDHVRVYGRK